MKIMLTSLLLLICSTIKVEAQTDYYMNVIGANQIVSYHVNQIDSINFTADIPLSSTVSYYRKPFKGKKMCLYGDSTFDVMNWASYMKEYLGFEVIYNRSVSGCGYVNGYVNTVYYWIDRADTSTVIRYGDPKNNPEIDGNNLPFGCKEIDAHQYSEQRIKTIPEDCDVILIGGGINDVNLGVNNFGEYKSFADIPSQYDFSKVGDCIIATIQGIRNRCPDAKILICGISPHINIWRYETIGKNALLMDEIIKSCAALLGVPFFSLIDNLGWGKDNILNYTDGVHPNTNKGERRYAETISGFVSSFPIF